MKHVIFFFIAAVFLQTACPAQCNFSLGNDTVVCQNSFTINGPAGYTTYLWSNGATTQNITVNTSGSYSLTATMLSGDLVVNGNFSAGNSGFFTAYGGPMGGAFGPLSWEGTYMVSTDPQLTHFHFLSFGDHTTGTGNMMVVNGSGNPNTIVWQQTINVVPATNYNFSTWVSSTLNLPTWEVAQLQFSINGSLIGPAFSAPANGGIWENFFVNWNSGANTTATIRIINQNTSTSGNDFAIDDVFFQEICVFSDTISVVLGAAVQVEIMPSFLEICNGEEILLSVHSSSTNLSFLWNSGQNSDEITVSPTQNTTYTISVTDMNGCSGSASATVNVHPNPTVVASAVPNAICVGESAVISATGGVSFIWSNGNTTDNFSDFPTTNTTYSVTGTDQNGCSGTSQISVIVHEIPFIEFSAMPLSGCKPLAVQFTNNGDDGIFLWQFGDGHTSTLKNPNHIYTQSGNYNVALTINKANCSETLTKNNYIVVFPSPVANFHTNNQYVYEDNPYVQFLDASTGANSWYWNFGTGNDGDNSFVQNPDFLFSGTGSYDVWQYVENQWGCIDSASKTITVLPLETFYIPNAFSPNGDGINDYFHPVGLISDPDFYKMRIFDRWGKLIFHTENIKTAWDGSSVGSKGEKIQTGVYTYLIEIVIDGYRKQFFGSVALIF